MIKMILINSEGQKDITQLITKVTWSGDYQQAARRLEFGILSSPADYYLPKINISPGNMVKFYEDSTLLFSGFIFTRDKTYTANEMSVTAYDGGIYLLKNQGAYNVKGLTPEVIAQKICVDFGIPTGTFAPTKIQINRIFNGDELYDIIMQAYTKAAEQNGKKYLCVMFDNKLNVIERGSLVVDFKITNGENLTNSNYSESLENMVNQVLITDEIGDTTGTNTVTFSD